MSEETQSAFCLRVEPLTRDALRLTLWQRSLAATGRAPAARRLGALDGLPLRVAFDHVLEVVRAEGYRDLRAGGQRGAVRRQQSAESAAGELWLSEEAGVRLGLLFLAIRPLRRVERIERVASSVRVMAKEETYYWFSKCTAPKTGRRARRALRILVAGE